MKGLIFTYLTTVGGSVGSLFNPFYGLLAYASFAIVRPVDMWPWSVPEGRYSLYLALSMIVGATYSKEVDFKLGKSWSILACLWGFLGWATFRAFGAPNQFYAWEYVDILFKIVVPFTVGLLTINSVDRLKQLAWTLVLSQGYVAWEANMYYWGGYNKLWYDGFGGVDNNSAAIGIVTGIGIAFFLAYHSEKWWQKCLAGGVVFMMAHAILISFSRGGMLGAILAGIGIAVVIPKRPRTYAMMGLIVFLIVQLTGDDVRARFMTIFEKKDGLHEASAQSRLDLWKDCAQIMTEKPVMGIGPNHWPLVAADYGWPPGKEAHSLWFQTGAELGFTGLILILGFYLLTIWHVWVMTWKRTQVRDEWHRFTARMCVIGLAGFVMSASFVSLEALEIPYYTVLLACGALKQTTAWRKPTEEQLLETAEAGIPVNWPQGQPLPGMARA